MTRRTRCGAFARYTAGIPLPIRLILPRDPEFPGARRLRLSNFGGKMMRTIGNLVFAAFFGGVVTLLGGQGAQADTISRDTLSRKMLDFCVFTQYKVEGIDRQSMINKCDCAAKQAMNGLKGDSFDSPSRSKLTGEQETAIRGGIASCFAAKK